MQKSYECEVATHIGPESCGAARKSSVEALTGERAGRVFSRVSSFLRDADAVRRSGRPHLMHRYREVCQSPARSETLCTYADTFGLDYGAFARALGKFGSGYLSDWEIGTKQPGHLHCHGLFALS